MAKRFYFNEKNGFKERAYSGRRDLRFLSYKDKLPIVIRFSENGIQVEVDWMSMNICYGHYREVREHSNVYGSELDKACTKDIMNALDGFIEDFECCFSRKYPIGSPSTWADVCHRVAWEQLQNNLAIPSEEFRKKVDDFFEENGREIRTSHGCVVFSYDSFLQKILMDVAISERGKISTLSELKYFEDSISSLKQFIALGEKFNEYLETFKKEELTFDEAFDEAMKNS